MCPLAVTDWMSKQTCGCQMPAGRRSVRRERARGRGVLYLQNRKVAVLPWELKWPLSGGRMAFQVNMRFRMLASGAAHAARTRARVGSCALCRLEKSPCCPGH